LNHPIRTGILAALIALTVGVSDSTGQVRPDKRLTQKISVQAEKRRVEDLIRELGEQNKLPVEFHPSVAADAAGETPVTLNVDGVSLGAVLRIVCQSASLVHAVDKGKLIVMTREADNANLFLRQYPLGPLGNIVDPQELAIGLTMLTSGPWADVDGEGGEIVAATPQGFTIRQNRAVHAELQELFEMLSGASGRARTPSPAERQDQMRLKKLQVPAPLTESELSLPDLLKQILTSNGVPYWVDEVAFLDEGVQWKELACAIDPKKLSPIARLDAVAAEHPVSWRFADEVIQLTTRVRGEELMVNRIYDVRRALGPNLNSAELARRLTANSDVGKWLEVDEEGGVVVPVGTSLIVRQNAAAHGRIAKLLSQ